MNPKKRMHEALTAEGIPRKKDGNRLGLAKRSGVGRHTRTPSTAERRAVPRPTEFDRPRPPQGL